jgi:hypothetical protein
MPQRECAADAGQAQGYNCLAVLPAKHTGKALARHYRA